ncbi:ABC transporter ATP-binding protein [Nocardioides sp.]|uniref:ABC transporter ATP-binding protein n=1 Tax=Nocardioides sp. TaxID=35761 RepID=UPI0039E27260
MSIEGLSKTYPGRPEPALDAVSLTVEAGEIVGLLGPNGAGKSTLVGCATTMVMPSAGRVRIAGVDVAAHPVRVKRLLGVVPQHNTLDRQVSVFENLYLHCRYYGIPRRDARARANALLEAFGLGDRATTRVGALSGGQARRLQVARALAHAPQVVFLDEPTVGLDPQSRQSLWDLLAELRDHGAAVVVSTHYMDEADVLADRVAVIDHGRIIALDTPSGLKASVNAETAISLSFADTPDETARRLTRLGCVRAVRQEESNGLRVLTVGDPDAALAAIVEVAVAEHPTGVSIEPVTLQTVFLELTGRNLT